MYIFICGCHYVGQLVYVVIMWSMLVLEHMSSPSTPAPHSGTPTSEKLGTGTYLGLNQILRVFCEEWPRQLLWLFFFFLQVQRFETHPIVWLTFISSLISSIRVCVCVCVCSWKCFSSLLGLSKSIDSNGILNSGGPLSTMATMDTEFNTFLVLPISKFSLALSRLWWLGERGRQHFLLRWGLGNLAWLWIFQAVYWAGPHQSSEVQGVHLGSKASFICLPFSKPHRTTLSTQALAATDSAPECLAPACCPLSYPPGVKHTCHCSSQ
jgi:hypothetical protein